VAADEEVTMGLRSRLAVVVFLVLAVVGTVVGTAKAVPYVASRLTTDDVGRRFSGAEAERPTRIISLVPAATEMIFAMGNGERVVGVSDYDRFPAGVSRLAKVGGLLDPNVERIISLRPDLVVVYATQKELVQRLERGGIPYFSYEHRGLPDIMTTVRAIGARIGSATRADAVASDMDRSLAGIRTTTARLPHPATLLVFSRDPSSLRNVYASGGYGFLHDMLEIAGGTNVFGEIKRQSVQASTEMLINRRPDVIIELRYGDSLRHADVSKELQVWNALGSVPAVRNHRVVALVGDEFVVPGPRVVDATRRLARALHPEAFR
jgi:iron complex transport system substrate-binding protein